ncbi:MAG: T9SS type A sorting domain-containing protein [Bacteroidales bacterium]|nr:T9SS type A sorting domain-containing protein [Bacteroidales bacterium]
MKKSIIFIILFASIFQCFAQSNKIVEVKHSGYDKIVLSLSANQINVTNVNTDKGMFSHITMDGFLPSHGAIGNPDLPTLVEMLEIPLCDRAETKIISQQWQKYTASQIGLSHPIYPLQPSRSKSEQGQAELVINQETYSTDRFHANAFLEFEKSGIARDKNLATLYFSPVSYNPVSGEIEICTQLEVEIIFHNADIEGTQRMKRLHHSPLFNSANTINELPKSSEKSEISSAPIRYLIIAHNSFRGLLDTFVEWKRRKGFITDIVYTGEPRLGTTTTSIANYVKSQYTNATATRPAPTFLLLVGDVEQIPAFTGNADDHSTDLYYASWTSEDIIPDCYYGRFSAKTEYQLIPQIEKTLMYEQYTMPFPSYLERALLIAGIDDGEQGDYGYTHADPTMKYIRNTYIDTSYGYSYVGYYDNSDYTLDNHGNAAGMTSILANTLSRGTCLAIYSAHGSSSGWANPKFGKSDLEHMNNSKKIGIMIGNCCSSCTYNDDECFGEALLRLPNYRGAVGYIGGSNSTYWGEDYYWAVGVRSIDNSGTVPTYNAGRLGAFDRLYHTHNETQSNWYTTLGGMMYSGNMAVQTSSSTKKIYYWEVYHLMGDPSIMPWLHTAETMEVTVATSIATGTTSLRVSAVPYAYIALTDASHNLVASAFANSNGNATLSFNALNAGNYELAASAQHYKTSFTTIIVNSNSIESPNEIKPRIYPNPAKDFVFVEKADMNAVTLMDMLGNEIITINNIDQNKVEINTKKCANGFYVLCVTDKNGQKSFFKIVKK